MGSSAQMKGGRGRGGMGHHMGVDMGVRVQRNIEVLLAWC